MAEGQPVAKGHATGSEARQRLLITAARFTLAFRDGPHEGAEELFSEATLKKQQVSIRDIL